MTDAISAHPPKAERVSPKASGDAHQPVGSRVSPRMTGDQHDTPAQRVAPKSVGSKDEMGIPKVKRSEPPWTRPTPKQSGERW